jgi:hypothetical protein
MDDLKTLQEGLDDIEMIPLNFLADATIDLEFSKREYEIRPTQIFLNKPQISPVEEQRRIGRVQESSALWMKRATIVIAVMTIAQVIIALIKG